MGVTIEVGLVGEAKGKGRAGKGEGGSRSYEPGLPEPHLAEFQGGGGGGIGIDIRIGIGISPGWPHDLIRSPSLFSPTSSRLQALSPELSPRMSHCPEPACAAGRPRTGSWWVRGPLGGDPGAPLLPRDLLSRSSSFPRI